MEEKYEVPTGMKHYWKRGKLKIVRQNIAKIKWNIAHHQIRLIKQRNKTHLVNKISSKTQKRKKQKQQYCKKTTPYKERSVTLPDLIFTWFSAQRSLASLWYTGKTTTGIQNTVPKTVSHICRRKIKGDKVSKYSIH